MEKISQYPNTVATLQTTDLLDVSVDTGGGSFESQKLPWSNLLSNLPTLYSADGQLAGNRDVDLNSNSLGFTNGNVAFGGTAATLGRIQSEGATDDKASTVFAGRNASSVNKHFLYSDGGAYHGSGMSVGINTPGTNVGYSANGADFEIDFRAESVFTGADHYAFYHQTSAANTGFANVGVYLDVLGGDDNYAILVNNGFSGFGTLAPTADIHIDGSFRYVDGNEQAGYVLTADANGNGTWQVAGAGVSFGADNQIPYTNAGGTDFDYSADLTYDGTTFFLKGQGSTTGVLVQIADDNDDDRFVMQDSGEAEIFLENTPESSWLIKDRVSGNTRVGFYNAATGSAGGIIEAYNASNVRVVRLGDGPINPYINAGLNFGVNTSSPSASLDVESVATIDSIQLKNTSSAVRAQILHSSTGGGFRFWNGAGTVVAQFNTQFATQDYFNTGKLLAIGQTTATSQLDVNGDIEIGSADHYYFGDPTTDTSWRIVRSGDDLIFQQREAGVWNTKSTISGA